MSNPSFKLERLDVHSFKFGRDSVNLFSLFTNLKSLNIVDCSNLCIPNVFSGMFEQLKNLQHLKFDGTNYLFLVDDTQEEVEGLFESLSNLQDLKVLGLARTNFESQKASRNRHAFVKAFESTAPRSTRGFPSLKELHVSTMEPKAAKLLLDCAGKYGFTLRMTPVWDLT